MKRKVSKLVTSVLVGAMMFSTFPAFTVFADEQDPTSYYSYNTDVSYEVSTQITASWDKHVNVDFTFTNTGSETIDNWYFTFKMPYSIENIWNASIIDTDNAGTYTIGNATWNQDIKTGSSVTVGMTLSGEDDDFSSMPSSYILNTKTNTIDPADYSVSYVEQSAWAEGFTGALYVSTFVDL